jgi:hypothetical protein
LTVSDSETVKETYRNKLKENQKNNTLKLQEQLTILSEELNNKQKLTDLRDFAANTIQETQDENEKQVASENYEIITKIITRIDADSSAPEDEHENVRLCQLGYLLIATK